MPGGKACGGSRFPPEPNPFCQFCALPCATSRLSRWAPSGGGRKNHTWRKAFCALPCAAAAAPPPFAPPFCHLLFSCSAVISFCTFSVFASASPFVRATSERRTIASDWDQPVKIYLSKDLCVELIGFAVFPRHAIGWLRSFVLRPLRSRLGASSMHRSYRSHIR